MNTIGRLGLLAFLLLAPGCVPEEEASFISGDDTRADDTCAADTNWSSCSMGDSGKDYPTERTSCFEGKLQTKSCFREGVCVEGVDKHGNSKGKCWTCQGENDYFGQCGAGAPEVAYYCDGGDLSISVCDSGEVCKRGLTYNYPSCGLECGVGVWGHCLDNVAINCHHEEKSEKDCSETGQTCERNSQGYASCK